jgi:1-phosphofructokinase family hexose kinase
LSPWDVGPNLDSGGCVLVVTPNLCFDRTLWTDRFEAGTVSRPFEVVVTAGGKGVNVVRTLRDLGHDARLLGFVAAGQGTELERLLAEEGTDLQAVRVSGSVRVSTVVIEADGRGTVLNEPGPKLGEQDTRALLAAVREELAEGGHTVVVCAGSLPPGLPDDTYGRVVEVAHEHGAVVVLDTSGRALAAALPFGPDAVTPNLGEAEMVLGGADTERSTQAEAVERTRAAALSTGARLRDLGARTAIVTVGSHGVAWVEEDRSAHWEPSREVVLVNPIGAGDSFVAGLAAALAQHECWRTAVPFAVTVAGAAVEQPTAGRVDADRVAELSAAGRAAR